MLTHCAVIIPAYNPEPEFVTYIQALLDQGIENIIVINDGSLTSTQSTFEQISRLPHCTILVHQENRGKGRALKTAFQYLVTERPDITTMVTADADGQHAVADVIALFEHLEQKTSGIVLGVRNFNEAHVPSKNAFGNKLTSRVFKWLFGSYISDTQTGLRGFAASEIGWLLALKGERFEYEMNMLMYAVQQDVPITEITIQTIYFGEKHSTHYKTFRDSFRIAKQLVVGFTLKKRLVNRSEAPMGEGGH